MAPRPAFLPPAPSAGAGASASAGAGTGAGAGAGAPHPPRIQALPHPARSPFPGCEEVKSRNANAFAAYKQSPWPSWRPALILQTFIQPYGIKDYL